MMNDSPRAKRRRRPRLTRRGRLAILTCAVLVAAGAVLIPVLLSEDGDIGEPASLVVPEGRRAGDVYASVDRVLDAPPGTTRKAAAAAQFDLPPEARGNLEGYLFPATYPIGPGSTPAGLLSYMVSTANQRFEADRITAGARSHRMTVYQLVSLASILQAEAETTADMGKVARVIHNRLAAGMPLQMDSTINYALNRNTLDTTHSDTKINSPYNTYRRTGLPPTPIGNPGEDALNAAIHPTPGRWLYFVTVTPGDTRFSETYAEHQRNVDEFNQKRQNSADRRPLHIALDLCGFPRSLIQVRPGLRFRQPRPVRPTAAARYPGPPPARPGWRRSWTPKARIRPDGSVRPHRTRAVDPDAAARLAQSQRSQMVDQGPEAGRPEDDVGPTVRPSSQATPDGVIRSNMGTGRARPTPGHMRPPG